MAHVHYVDSAWDVGRRYPSDVKRPERNREMLSALLLLVTACVFVYIL